MQNVKYMHYSDFLLRFSHFTSVLVYSYLCHLNETEDLPNTNLCPLVHSASLCIKHIAGAVTLPHYNCNRAVLTLNIFPVLADIIVKTCDSVSSVSLRTGVDLGGGAKQNSG